ncbi:hypothetical protein LTS18_010866, partial [Coniosporium uncinatum]
CFTTYPTQPYQDDTFLSKPAAAYDWLHFHDTLSAQVHGSSQEWELAPYLSQAPLAFHHLFASPASARHTYSDHNSSSSNKKFGSALDNRDGDGEAAELSMFMGPGAAYHANEALKSHTAHLTALQSSLSLPLTRMYRSHADIATELLPCILRMLSPDVKPVIITSSAASGAGAGGGAGGGGGGGGGAGGKTFATSTASVRKASEKVLVERGVRAMMAVGVRFERTRIEHDDLLSSSSSTNNSHASRNNGGWVLRMEPPVDELVSFSTMDRGGGGGGGGGRKNETATRYAVRQVLEQELRRTEKLVGEGLRMRRGGLDPDDLDNDDSATAKDDKKANEVVKKVAKAAKRDFFGRILVAEAARSSMVGPGAGDAAGGTGEGSGEGKEESREARRKRVRTENGEGRVWVSFHEGFSNA